ncbi:hypothetical protein [Aquiflexum sp.]|uniref:hypothetical protein n=1 Tax=Aquiflexum sp. TaxID=1872584 RepID=UPI0035933F74
MKFLWIPLFVFVCFPYLTEGQSDNQNLKLRTAVSFPYLIMSGTERLTIFDNPQIVTPVGITRQFNNQMYFDLEFAPIMSSYQITEFIFNPGIGISLPYNFLLDTRISFRLLEEKNTAWGVSFNKLFKLIDRSHNSLFLVCGIAFPTTLGKLETNQPRTETVLYLQVSFGF